MAVLAATMDFPTREDDSILLSRLASRDADALTELYDRYGRTVFSVLYRMLPNAEAAEEVCQDAFQHVWRAAATYRGERGAVRTWVLAIARNAAIDWRRTRGRREERETVLDDAFGLASPSSVEEVVDRRLRAQRMRDLVSELPPEQRRCLELAYWGGLSQTEIAATTGAPLGTVKSRIRSGMEKLRSSLGPVAGGAA